MSGSEKGREQGSGTPVPGPHVHKGREDGPRGIGQEHQEKRCVCVCVHSCRVCLHERYNGICHYMWGIKELEASHAGWLVYESQFKTRVMIDLHSSMFVQLQSVSRIIIFLWYCNRIL